LSVAAKLDKSWSFVLPRVEVAERKSPEVWRCLESGKSRSRCPAAWRWTSRGGRSPWRARKGRCPGRTPRASRCAMIRPGAWSRWRGPATTRRIGRCTARRGPSSTTWFAASRAAMSGRWKSTERAIAAPWRASRWTWTSAIRIPSRFRFLRGSRWRSRWPRRRATKRPPGWPWRVSTGSKAFAGTGA